MVRWGGRKINDGWGLSIFSPNPSKSFLSKMGRKLKEENEILNGRKCPCALAHGQFVPFFFFFFFFFFFGRLVQYFFFLV